MGKIRASQSSSPSGSVLGGAKVVKPAARKRASKKERAANDPYEPESKLVDSLRTGLLLVLIGLNPGLETARTGHAYSHSTNKFWPILHQSGLTAKRHQPSETRDLMDLYQIGNTNIVARPTRDGSTIAAAELAEGAEILNTKIRAFRPEAVGIVGKGVWEAIWLARTGKKMKKADFKYGWQDEEANLGRQVNEKGEVVFEGAKTFVTTTTSALAATTKLEEKIEIWKPLGFWLIQRREQLAETHNVEE